jgi:hypothetical protein
LDDWIYCTLYIVHAIQRDRWCTHITVQVTHVLGFLGFTSRILATGSEILMIHCHFKSYTQSNSFLAISSHSPSNAISRILPNSRQQLTEMNPSWTEFSQLLRTINCSLRTSRWEGPHGKRRLLFPHIILGVCTDPLPSDRLLLLRSFAPTPSRCLTVGLYVTVCTNCIK